MLSDGAVNGRILRINLTTGDIWVDEPSEAFLRMYYGGAIGAYYLFTETKPGIDPLAPANILTFTPGFLSHLPVGAYNRLAITAKSPLTGCIIDSQAGGFWAPECKMAGYDAVVIQGRASHPVYIWINGGDVQIQDASSLWGQDTGAADRLIRQQIGKPRLRICLIGPAGENLVRYACISNNLRHFAGRGGLGAVMGSKNLKAIAVSGDPSRTPISKDRSRVMELLKQVNQTYADDEFINTVMTPLGTHWAVWYNQSHGRLPTHNFEEGVFEGADRIDHRNMSELKMFKASEGCYACRVRCKRAVELDDGQTAIAKRYGGAEYETLGNLGPLLGIDNLVAIEKANELCARFTIDTVSCGATLAWAFDCFQKGIITSADTGGLELRWGDAAVVVKLIDMIARREGFGEVLAEGTRRASARFGAPAEALAAHNKGLEWPAVDPRVEPAQALAYAVCPIGADHMTRGGEDLGPGFWELATPPREDGFSGALVRSYYLQRTLGSVVDGFGICCFLAGATGLDRTVAFVEAATGWRMSIWEMMRAGDRRVTMLRAYNAREGFTIEDDTMPARAFKPIKSGPEDGRSVDPDAHARAVHDYYLLSGWEPETGWPTRGKLLELGLEWMVGEGPPPLAAGDGQVLEKVEQQNLQERREG